MEKIKYLTKDELTKLFKKINDPRDLALFSTMYYHGLRCVEASRLRLQDLRLSDGRIFIHAAKNGISGDYILAPQIKKILKDYILNRTDNFDQLFHSRKGGPLDRSYIFQLFKKYAKMAKLPTDRQNPHVLRHSVAVQLLEDGMTIEACKVHLRHRKIDSTLVYAQITDRVRDRLQKDAFSNLSFNI
jgi:integrase/recombinase XerD